MINVLPSPWADHFDDLIRHASRSLIIASPFIAKGPCERLISIKSNRTPPQDFSVLLVTDLSRNTLLNGSTDAAAICDLSSFFPNIEIRFLPSLHAKVYVADEQLAVVTSANMTNNGLLRNFEYGIKLQDKTLIQKIRMDIIAYAQLGARIDLDKLRFLAQTSAELNQMLTETEKSFKARLRAEFKRRLSIFDEEIIRTRAAGRAPHTIFAEAILYLLKHKPLSTAEMHTLIQGIHPDLCDDSIDRVIDGKHFGKKWKHAVRTAQQHLKRDGRVDLTNGKWYLKSHEATTL